MRVLHLPCIICNQPWEMSRGLRRIGIKSDYMIWDDNDASWLLPGPPDYNLNIYHRGPNYPSYKIRYAIKWFLFKSLFKYDVFHYHSNYSLLDYEDLKILKSLGKKIVVSYWGCDIRLKKINSQYKYNACKSCKIDCRDNVKLAKMANFQKYADLLIVHDPDLIQYCDGCKYIPQSLDTTFWQSDGTKKNSTVFRVFHPFGNGKARGNTRGTVEIKSAIAKLNREGYQVEMVYKDGLKNRELKPFYDMADVVIEQLRDGDYGITTIEALSMGKPVLGYISPKYQKYFNDLPIINTNLDNIYQKLKWAMDHKEELNIIGDKSRKYAIKNHDSKIIAQKIYQLYKTLY